MSRLTLSLSQLADAWQEFQQAQLEVVYTTLNPKDLGIPVLVDGSTSHVAPAMRQHTQEGDQAPILTTNSWDHFTTVYPPPPPSYAVPAQYSPSPMILPFDCASSGLSGIPSTVSPAPSSTRSNESILDSPLGQTHDSYNDFLCSTLFQSGQIFSGPTSSNFVLPSISPGSHASTASPPGTNGQHPVVGNYLPAAFNPVGSGGNSPFASNGVAKFYPAPNQAFALETSLQEPDLSANDIDLLFMGLQWGGEMHNPGLYERETPPSHGLYDYPEQAPSVDIVNVSNPPCEAGIPIPIPFPRMGMDSSSLYQSNSQYQHGSPSYFPGTLLDHFPISDAPNTPLTTEEEEGILTIELDMRNPSPLAQLASQCALNYAGSSSVAAPTSFKQDRQDAGIPVPSQPDVSYAPEHQAGSSFTVDQHSSVNSRIFCERPPTSDLGSRSHSVPGQSMGQFSTEPGMFPLNMGFLQPPLTTPSSVLNPAPSSSSQQPTPIVRRQNRKRRRELELDYDAARSDDTPISATCEWDGCGEHLASVGDFRKHFVKLGAEAPKHNLPAGNNTKTQTICLWEGCQKPVACVWRHLREVHGGFPRLKRRRL